MQTGGNQGAGGEPSQFCLSPALLFVVVCVQPTCGHAVAQPQGEQPQRAVDSSCTGWCRGVTSLGTYAHEV